LQQKLFLDIACFFNGANINNITHKLESFGYYPNINIEVLADKSLISISWGRLWVHDLLRKMGQKIVDDESEEPGRRSRLWHEKDVICVLKNDTVSGLAGLDTNMYIFLFFSFLFLLLLLLLIFIFIFIFLYIDSSKYFSNVSTTILISFFLVTRELMRLKASS
jgi:hypothetical protein